MATITTEMFNQIEDGTLKAIATRNRYGYAEGDILDIRTVDRSDQSSPISVYVKDSREDSNWYSKCEFKLVLSEDLLSNQDKEKYSKMNPTELSEEYKALSELLAGKNETLAKLNSDKQELVSSSVSIQDKISEMFGLKEAESSEFKYDKIISGEDVTEEDFQLVAAGKARVRMTFNRWSRDKGEVLSQSDTDERFDADDYDDNIRIRDSSDGAFEWIKRSQYELLVQIEEKTSELEEVDINQMYKDFKETQELLSIVESDIETLSKDIGKHESRKTYVRGLGLALFN